MNTRAVQVLLIVAIIGILGSAGFFSYKILHPENAPNSKLNTVNPIVDNSHTGCQLHLLAFSSDELRPQLGSVSSLAINNTVAGYYSQAERERITNKTLRSAATVTELFANDLESKKRNVRAFISITAFATAKDAEGEYLFTESSYGEQATNLFSDQVANRAGSFKNMGIENFYFNFVNFDAKETRDWTVIAHDSNIMIIWIFRLPAGKNLNDLENIMAIWNNKFSQYKSNHSGLLCATDVAGPTANTNAAIQNTNNQVSANINLNTNNTAVTTNTANGNSNVNGSAPCDYSVTKIPVPADANDIPLPSGWVHFTPDTGHFTVNLPATPKVVAGQQLLPYPDDPYLISHYQTYPSPQTNGTLAYFMQEDNHCSDSAVKDANQYFQGRIKEVSGNGNYANISSKISTYRGYPSLDYTHDTNTEVNKKYSPDQNQKFSWRIIVIGTTVFSLEVRDMAATFNEADSESFLNSFVPLIK